MPGSRDGGRQAPPPDARPHDPPEGAGGLALLVIGGGRCVWADLAAIDRGWRGERMAVNDIGAHYDGALTHWATLHPEYLPGWRRWRDGHNRGDRGYYRTHAERPAPGVDRAWRLAVAGGTSGLFACLIGLRLGYGRLVLAGLPMDGSGHYFDPPDATTPFANIATETAWIRAHDSVFGGRVTSLSGRTRDWLGAPKDLTGARA